MMRSSFYTTFNSFTPELVACLRKERLYNIILAGISYSASVECLSVRVDEHKCVVVFIMDVIVGNQSWVRMNTKAG